MILVAATAERPSVPGKRGWVGWVGKLGGAGQQPLEDGPDSQEGIEVVSGAPAPD